MRPSLHARLTPTTMPDWTSVPEAFGMAHRMHFSMYVFFYPNAPSNHSTDAYRRHEQAKKREYGQRVREVERGVFTPLVLSTNGGMGKEATTFYKQLADMIAQKRQHHYSMVMGWLRCRISFASLRSSVMCIRGSRSSSHRPINSSDISLAATEGRVPSY